MNVEVIAPREVPLGGIRALSVRRTLPTATRSFIGAWCFLDHYGPTAIGRDNSEGMDVAPHPHTGLQTVSWLFAGEIEHRDSAGVIGRIHPGEVNLMTAGAGIAHSEVSMTAKSILHGVQLWVALPDQDRHTTRSFEHHAPARVELPDGAGSALVFLGSLDGVDASPVRTFTPILGAQLDLKPRASVTLSVKPSEEHGVMVDQGAVTFNGTGLAKDELGCLDPGVDSLTLTAGAEGARLILLGGEPFEEEIVMWWNFVGRSHEEIVAFRDEYEKGSDRFGTVPGYVGAVQRIPAPALPNARLRPRNRRGRVGDKASGC